jgi:hypothetical protein
VVGGIGQHEAHRKKGKAKGKNENQPGSCGPRPPGTMSPTSTG